MVGTARWRLCGGMSKEVFVMLVPETAIVERVVGGVFVGLK